MANPKKRVPENASGEFFVDSTCIDCDACRQIAPYVFGEASGYAYVRAQPVLPDDRRQALRALLACPTGSIGYLGSETVSDVSDDFPLPVERPVYYCGYNSPKSFGGNSYFVRLEDGNWLVDSPKFVKPLVRQLEKLGGIDHIFLTHRDDVADADKYARYFGARRIIHRDEIASQPDAEIILDDHDPQELGSDFVAIPTPGHTRGHCVLLFQDRFLFTGDHLAWSRHENRLTAHRDYCWYSWTEQTKSMQRLSELRFNWVLPGHGQRVHLPFASMQRYMRELVERMRAGEN